MHVSKFKRKLYLQRTNYLTLPWSQFNLRLNNLYTYISMSLAFTKKKITLRTALIRFTMTVVILYKLLSNHSKSSDKRSKITQNNVIWLWFHYFIQTQLLNSRTKPVNLGCNHFTNCKKISNKNKLITKLHQLLFISNS